MKAAHCRYVVQQDPQVSALYSEHRLIFDHKAHSGLASWEDQVGAGTGNSVAIIKRFLTAKG